MYDTYRIHIEDVYVDDYGINVQEKIANYTLNFLNVMKANAKENSND